MGDSKKLRLLICGGGNGAHVLAGLASSRPSIEVRVLTLYADEAERWTNALKEGDMTTHLISQGTEVDTVVSKPSIVTKDPALGAADCDVITFVVPAFAHAQYLNALEPHIRPGLILAGLPGQAGFEFAVRGILGEKAKMCTVAHFESLPWACRIKKFGRETEVLGTKRSLVGAVHLGNPAPPKDTTETLQFIIGDIPVLKTHGHLLGISLMGVNAYLHPSILYGRWHDWDGNAVNEPPIFYNAIDKFSADTLSKISDEIMATAAAIMKARPGVDLTNVKHIYDWFMSAYSEDITDKKTLETAIRTNRAYHGLTHPTVKTNDGKYVPDFKYRYISEDIPYGLIVIRGVAEIAGVPTPYMDNILNWVHRATGKQYLVDGKVGGSNMGDTRSPQRYNLNNLDAILGL